LLCGGGTKKKTKLTEIVWGKGGKGYEGWGQDGGRELMRRRTGILQLKRNQGERSKGKRVGGLKLNYGDFL